jgi:hypothetical protein
MTRDEIAKHYRTTFTCEGCGHKATPGDKSKPVDLHAFGRDALAFCWDCLGHQVLAERANNLKSSKPGAPILGASSTRETLIQWLCWCDGNGTFTDEDSRAEGHEPLTLAECWGILADMMGRA